MAKATTSGKRPKSAKRIPIAWYLTWTTYGTWLHGDPRGSHSKFAFVPPNPRLEEEARIAMTGEPVFLDEAQRLIVDRAIVKECDEQGWLLHTRNVRTNHAHVVLSANRDGAFLRARLKAIASDALSEHARLPMVAHENGRTRWWTEKGNIIEVETEADLEAVTIYVRDLQ